MFGQPLTYPRSLSLRQLTMGMHDLQIVGDAKAQVTGIRFDSRLVEQGELFAALSGSDEDGHRFIPAALQRGASCLLVERPIESDVPQVIASDSRAALACLSAAFYGHPSRELTMIGLTGTDGKTTTSHLTEEVLRRSRRVTGLIGTVGIRIGTARTDGLPHQTTPESSLVHGYLREMVEAGVDTAIIEATSHGLAMHRLDQVDFDIAGVTNITREHLEYHGTVEQYRQAKAILVQRVAARRGVVVLNADDPGAMSIAQAARGAEIVFYSAMGRDAHFKAENVGLRTDATSFDVVIGGERWPVRLPLIGDFNVANALCTIGICRAAGAETGEILSSLAHASGVPGRMNRISEGQPFDVIVDYAHTPESLRKVLTLLRDLQTYGRLIVVTGSAGERDAGKRPLQGGVCAKLADICVFTNEDPRNEDADKIIVEIAAGALSHGGVIGETVFPITDRREAIVHAISIAGPGDMVLLTGKGHERSIIIGHDHVPWDEAAVARDVLRSLGHGPDEEWNDH